VRSTGRCSPGPSSPLERSPAFRGFGVHATHEVGTNPRLARPRNPVTWPHVFARLWIRPWGLEPTVRRLHRSIEPMKSPSGSEPTGERFREPPTRRSPAPRSSVSTGPEGPIGDSCPGRVARAPSRRRPAPPVLRPRASARGVLGRTWRRRSRSASRSAPRGVGHLLWGFAPRRSFSRVRVPETRGLDVLRTRGPYERFTSGSCAPSPERLAAPLGASRPSPVRGAFARPASLASEARVGG